MLQYESSSQKALEVIAKHFIIKCILIYKSEMNNWQLELFRCMRNAV